MNLTALFSAQSIAVIGASTNPNKVGAIVVRNLLESKYPGKIYPVNPGAEKITWLKCYPDITKLPEKPDLAVIAIPAEIAVKTLEQVGKQGIKNAVVFSAGFKEIGKEGEKLETQLIKIAQVYKLNLLGPNCPGFVNNAVPCNVTFAQVVNQPGNLRFISQSGAIASAIFDWFTATNLGFGQFITLGNKSVLNENHILQYFHELNGSTNENHKTKIQPIGLYLESIIDGKEFYHLASQLSQKHPLFILKPGKSEAAKKAMQSHTGAIAGEDAVLDSVLKQAGVIRCHGIQDFYDYAKTFAWQQAPQGPNVAIISNAGGPGVISADVIVEEGLSLAEIKPTLKKQLLTKLPREASIINPIDVLGDALAGRYADAMKLILKEKNVHSLLIILTPQVMTQIEQTAETIGQMTKRFKKPVVCSFMGGTNIDKGEAILNRYQIPSFRYPERAIKALAAMWRWQNWQQSQIKTPQMKAFNISYKKNQVQAILTQAKTEKRQTLDSFEVIEILKTANISQPASSQIFDVNQGQDFGEEHGWPVVLKLSSPNLMHKTEFGGVITGITNRQQLETGLITLHQRIENLEPKIRKTVKIQIQRQVSSGIEVIVGVKTDPNFSKILMVGAGGTFIEIIGDRNLHKLPISLAQAYHLLENSKIYQVLKGYRGKAEYNLEKLAELIVRLGSLAESFEDITEIEINPVIVTNRNVWAEDGKVVLN